MSIAERISGLVEKSGLDTNDFTQRAEFDEERLINALNGHRRFTSLDLAKIADFCQVTVDWLMTGKDPWSGIRLHLCQMPDEV